MMAHGAQVALPFGTSADRLPDVQQITEDPYGSQRWQKITCLGESSFGGRVYHTRNMDLDGGLGLPEEFVVKKIAKVNIFDAPGLECPANEMRASMLIAQIQRGQGFSSNVIKVYDVFQDSQYFYLVTERCHQELYSAVQAGQQWSADEIREMCRQMLESTAALHGHDIAHQDISVENFVLRWQDGVPSVRLIDLGQAVRNAQHLAVIDGRGYPGKERITSPELWLGRLTRVAGIHYSAKKHDVFQVGVAIFILLVGKVPFALGDVKPGPDGRPKHWLFPKLDADRCTRLREMLEKHWRVMDRVPAEALDLLERLLAPNPDLRITAAEALEHPWFAISAAEAAAEEQTPEDYFTPDKPGTTTPAESDTTRDDNQAATAATTEFALTAPVVGTVSANVASAEEQTAEECFAPHQPGTTAAAEPDATTPEDMQAATAATADCAQTALAVGTISAKAAVSPMQAAAASVSRAVSAPVGEIAVCTEEVVANSGVDAWQQDRLRAILLFQSKLKERRARLKLSSLREELKRARSF